jgi:TP901 family phage tail tape measure protein
VAGLIVGRITAQLGLDDNGFTRGVTTAGRSMTQLGTQAKQAETSIAAAMKGAVSDVDRYAAKVAQARANQASAAAKAEKAERSLKSAQDSGNAQKAADAEIRLEQARARLTTATQTTQEAVAGLSAANAEAAETSDGATESITNMGDSSDTTAGKLAALAIGAVGVGASFASVLTIGMDFTTSLNTMQAVSGATAAQMKQVSDAARTLGSDIDLPGTSANDAAAAMTELAKGGFSVDQSMQAAKGTLQLAAAAQIEAGQAATIQSQALQAFGEDAAFAGQAADILANGANASSAEMTDIADALQQAGTVASGFGVDMADTTTVLGLFANAGITGSDAGTLLKTSLQSLTDGGAPAQQAIEDLGLTVYDANGNFAGMRLLWDELSVASKTMTDEQFQAATAVLFGSDAMRTAMITAGGGVEAYDKMREAIGKQGSAADVAAAKTQGLPGAWERVQNSMEAVALTTYGLIEGPLTSLAGSGANMIGMADGLAGSLGFVVAPLGLLASGFAALPGPIQTLITLMIAAKIASMAFGSQIQSVRNYATNAAGVMRNYGTSVTNMQRAATLAGGSMSRLSGHLAVLGRNSPTIASMGAAYIRASAGASTFARTAGVAAAATVGMRGAAAGLTGALGGPWGIAIAAATVGLMFWMNSSQKAKQRTAEHKAAVDELSKSIDVSTGKLNQQGREAVGAKLDSSGILKVIEANKEWGVSIDQYTDAATGQIDAIDAVNGALDKQVRASVESSDYWKTNAKDYEAAGISLQELTAAIRGNADVQKSVEGKMKAAGWENYGSAIGRAKNSLDENGRSAIKTGDALGNMNANIDEAAAAAMRQAQANGTVVKSLDGATEAVGPMTAAMTEFEESTDGAASKVDKLAKALDQFNDDAMTEEEALQAWSDNLRDVAKAMEEGGTAAIGLNGQIDVTTEKGSALQDSVRSQAEAFNNSAAAAYEYARSQGEDVPQALETTRQRLGQLRSAFVDQMTVMLGSREQAEALADKYKLIPEEVILRLDTTAVQAGIDKLGELGIKTTALPEGKIRITDTSPENMERLKQLGIITETLPDGSVVVNLADEEARRRMAELLKTETKTILIDNKPIQLQYGQTAESQTGTRRFGGIQTFAQGGHHIDKPMTAGIYQPAADYTIFAEKETKGETYLPWDLSTRGRSLGIMQETANAWGFQVVPLNVQSFADGGISTAGALKDYMRGIEGAAYDLGGWGQGWVTDCSGGQSIAMNYADGLNDQPGTGERAGTAAFDGYTASHGLQPGQAPSGIAAYEVGWSPEHTAGTIIDPVGGDVNVEMGGGRGDGQFGGPTGSRDSQFNSIAWMALQGDLGGTAGAPDTRTEKQKNIDIVVAEGKRRGETEAEIKSAVMAMLDESNGENLDHGSDGDNAGIFSQRPSWGTKEQRMDPVYATNAYYDAANKVDQEGLTPAQLAQAVQKSGTADGSNYAEKEAEADAEIAASITRSTQTTSTTSSGMGSGPTQNVYVVGGSLDGTGSTSTTTASTTATPDATSTTGPEVFGKGPLPLVAYALGGIDSKPGSAQMLNGERTWLTQAGEAGVEAYIPINGSDRSKSLWAETGKRLGVMEAFANGGFGGYAADTSDSMKPRNWYDWAALAAGTGFAAASMVTPYIGMAAGGSVDLGSALPTVDTSNNSIDGVAQAISTAIDPIQKQIEELTKAVIQSGKTLHVVDNGNAGAASMLMMQKGM